MPGEFRKTELIEGVVVTTFTVDDAHHGSRVDQFLKNQYAYFSRQKIQTFIDEERVLFFGHDWQCTSKPQWPIYPTKKLKPSTVLHAGDQLKILTQKTQEPEVRLDFKILYEDEDVLVVDKPGNLPVHPAGKFLFNTLLMQLRKMHPEHLENGENFFLIHRLDRETSGALLIAKKATIANKLIQQFRNRTIEKKYYAITSTTCKQNEFIVDLEIGSSRTSNIRLKMAAFEKGSGEMPSLTHFKVLKRGTKRDLIECDLKTGRQHQIRVHLAAIGNPVFQDKLYGNESQNEDDDFLRYLEEKKSQKTSETRHALHSCYLKFFHPTLARDIEIHCPLPEDMKEWLE